MSCTVDQVKHQRRRMRLQFRDNLKRKTLLHKVACKLKQPVILVVGVNGVGKTTSVAKIAQRFQQQGQSVLLAAADTFRAAAVEQLQTWGEKLDIPVIAQHQGADAAAVAHDALTSAQARKADVLLIDTAGRQHTHSDLMEQLKKI